MTDLHKVAFETIRDPTLQIMLIAAGVFGIVGGFVGASDRKFTCRCTLFWSLLLFSLSVLFGYLVHGVLISLVAGNSFDPFNGVLTGLGVAQVAAFFFGGLLFIFFVIGNINQ